MGEIVFQKVDKNMVLCFDEKWLSKQENMFVLNFEDKKMTDKQRGSLHVWCSQVATVLNEANMFFEWVHPITRVTIEKEWGMLSVKEHIYKPTLARLHDKASTEDQNTVEPSDISEAISRAFAMHSGIQLPSWPSRR